MLTHSQGDTAALQADDEPAPGTPASTKHDTGLSGYEPYSSSGPRQSDAQKDETTPDMPEDIVIGSNDPESTTPEVKSE